MKVEVIEKKQTININNSKNYSTTTIKQEVQKTFGSSSIMVYVASCESRFRQLNKDGTVFRGVQNPKDVGVMQINEYYHLETSRKLGYNIHTLEGNLGYGKYLYDREGTTPWNWSKPMWSKGECKS